MAGTRYAQFCALARAAEIIGERWTLLIVRELLLGPKRFADLSARLEGVSPTILTGCLHALVERGIVRREALPAPFNAQVYALTAAGDPRADPLGRPIPVADARGRCVRAGMGPAGARCGHAPHGDAGAGDRTAPRPR